MTVIGEALKRLLLPCYAVDSIPRRARRLILCSLVSLALIVGCTQQPDETSVEIALPHGTDASDSERVKELQSRLDALLQPVDYKYTSSGKPDPFQPFVRSMFAPQKRITQGKDKDETRRPQQCDTPLECMDVGQLTLVAIVTKEGGDRLALAQDASGIGYILHTGTRIGYRNGKVTKILADRIIVTEEAENLRGEATLQDRVLLLHPEEQ